MATIDCAEWSAGNRDLARGRCFLFWEPMSTTAWHNRIVGYGEEAPDQLLAHEKNWRTHPKTQQDALRGVLSEVGVVQNVIVNQRTGRLVDGHLRVMLAMRSDQPSIPVTYIDVSDAEESLILATLDPISALAGADRNQLDALLREVNTSDAALQVMLGELAVNASVVPPGGFDGQGTLDEKAKTTCPECGHVF